MAKTAFKYLEHAGLIEPENGGADANYVISESGFHVAFEREVNQRQWDIDLSTAVVTAGFFILTAMSIIQGQVSGWLQIVALIGAGALFIWAMSRVKRFG